jgi:hypothetical protein
MRSLISKHDESQGMRVFHLHTGLPDGLFSNQKYQFGQISEGLRLENVDIFAIFEYFTDIWDFL